jgi:hypothetical protein
VLRREKLRNHTVSQKEVVETTSGRLVEEILFQNREESGDEEERRTEFCGDQRSKIK